MSISRQRIKALRNLVADLDKILAEVDSDEFTDENLNQLRLYLVDIQVASQLSWSIAQGCKNLEHSVRYEVSKKFQIY